MKITATESTELPFSTSTLSFDASCPGANREYLHNPYIANKKAQLTQGLRATALRVYRHLGFLKFESCTISSAVPENPTLEPNMEWIGCTVCEIFTFKLYCDLETGVRDH